MPDLTKRQRDEEAELKKEAERRNRSLTEMDLSKNLHWVVVGARGERRLTKEKVDSERSYQRGGPARGGREEDGVWLRPEAGSSPEQTDPAWGRPGQRGR